ncbi:ExeM/NucH family extracellular endonuclease [candidate division KSB1 bacterium]|nr:ExeM/NucH family extracellular endonuclease [candidate division KSB1 bacterium]RQW07790.1 MAG: ExeM/NucH family extracellular endonuclease [candidate division KSB1 bacterium]
MKNNVHLFIVFVCIASMQVNAEPDLFISEYVEGSGFNKALELYNGTGSPIDLSGYTLERYTNGAAEVSSSLSLAGILEHEDVWVVAHSSADLLLIEVADITNGSVLGYNGDDAIALRRGETLIDIIGIIGQDPGTEWGSDLLSTADNTLRRSPTVCSGNAVFSLETEWSGYAVDTFDGIGVHSADCGQSTTPIYDIQYTADPGGDSPFKDQANIVTDGIVTGRFSGGYFIAEPAGGPWRGLWISDSAHDPALADRIRLTGTVREVDGRTELHDVIQFQLLSSANALPAPEIVTSGGVAAEQWESVLVCLANVTVTGTDLEDGEWTVNDGSGEVRVGSKGAFSYVPAVNDQLVQLIGLVDWDENRAVVQPRSDADIHRRVNVALVINEILADPDAADGDANGDGVVDTADDEFVEIVNTSDGDLDLSGWTVADAASVRHIFADGTLLRQGGALVLFGGGSPSGDFGGALVLVASSGSLSLNNTGDTVTLNDGASDVLTETYGATAGDNQSITRSPDVIGDTFIKHSLAPDADGALYSPGLFTAGYSLSATLIHEIQGSGALSPYEGRSGVMIEGIVTGDFQAEGALSGFFMQEETAQFDAHESTSEGIFVRDDGFGVDVKVGDVVRVTGTVHDYYDRTEMMLVTRLIVRHVALPEAHVVILPMASDELEAFEGMLIQIEQELTVTGTNGLLQYGELELAVNGRLFTPTNSVAPGTDAVNLQLENGRRRIQIDDGSRVENPAPIPYFIENTLRLGSTLPSLTGVLDYSFGQYEIHPTENISFTDANPRVEPASVNSSVKAAAFNVCNFFNGDGQGGGFPTSRGAATWQDYIRQREKLINAMAAIDAAVLGVVELENDGFGAGSAIQDLVNGLNEATAGAYRFIDPGLDRIGDDEITCGIIYKSAIFTPIGDVAILDHTVNALFDASNRPSLAQTFQDARSEKFTFVVNHFRSKSTPCPGDEDAGDGQGHCNQTRVNAAIALKEWLAATPTGVPDDDFLLMGDFNAYLHEDPVMVLKDAGYINLIETGMNGYSYVYEAQSGAIDHALGSASLYMQTTGTTLWHINADEPAELGYSSTNPAALYDAGPYRSSDHDPVIVGLELAPIVIKLSFFQARFEKSHVTIQWRTESEMNVAGYNVLRSEASDGLFIKINDDLIVSQGDSGRGADYAYFDLAGSLSSFYRLESVTLDGQVKSYGPVSVTIAEQVGEDSLPNDFALYVTHPNPFNPFTTIQYDVANPGHVEILLYDVRGRLVRTLLNANRNAGSFEIQWDGQDDAGHTAAAGLYFCRMRTGDFVGVQRMLLIK